MDRDVDRIGALDAGSGTIQALIAPPLDAFSGVSWIFSPIFSGHAGLVWLGFVTLCPGRDGFDLGVLHRDSHEVSFRESLMMSGLYIVLQASPCAVFWLYNGPAPAGSLDELIVNARRPTPPGHGRP